MKLWQLLTLRKKKSLTPFTYLVRSDFTTAASAPVGSPYTCEPGPGTLTLTDTGNRLSIAGGKLTFASGGTAGDPGVWGAVRTRAAGLAMLAEVTKTASGGTQTYLGWDTNTTGTADAASIYLASLSVYARIAGATTFALESFALSTSYAVAVVTRASGAWYCIKGGAFTEWTLIYVTPIGNTSSIYPAIADVDMAATYDTLRVAQLSAPWNSEYGIATQRIASASVGDTLAAESNGLVEMTWTAVTGQTLELSVRRTDDDNRWIVRGDQAGSTIKLIERNAGTETERSNAAQTWTNGAAYRVLIVMDGNSIKTYTGTGTAKNSYASASFNGTATGVHTNRAGTEYIAWPRTLSGSALSALNRMAA